MSGIYTNGLTQQAPVGTDRILIETAAAQGLNPQQYWASVTQIGTSTLMADEESRSEGPDLELDVKDKGSHLITLASPTTKLKLKGMESGQKVRLLVKQDGTGSRKLTFEDVMWAEGKPPVLSTTAGALDMLWLTYHGKLKKWFGEQGGKAWVDPEAKPAPKLGDKDDDKDTKDETKTTILGGPAATPMPAPTPGPRT